MKVDESDKVKYDDEFLSDEDSFQFLQQKECIDELLNKGKVQYGDCDREKDEHNDFLYLTRGDRGKEEYNPITYLRIVAAVDSRHEEQLLTVFTVSEEGCLEVENHKSLEEGIQSLKDWHLYDVVNEESVDISRIIISEFIDLYEEMKLKELEQRTSV